MNSVLPAHWQAEIRVAFPDADLGLRRPIAWGRQEDEEMDLASRVEGPLS